MKRESWKQTLGQPFLLGDLAIKKYAEKYDLSGDIIFPVISDLSEERRNVLKDKTFEEAKQVDVDDLVEKALKEEGLA